jgi:hypothetical protein
MPILRQAVAKASEFGTVLGSGLLVSQTWFDVKGSTFI